MAEDRASRTASAFSVDLKRWLNLGQKGGEKVEDEKVQHARWSDNVIGSLVKSFPTANFASGQQEGSNNHDGDVVSCPKLSWFLSACFGILSIFLSIPLLLPPLEPPPFFHLWFVS